MKLNLMVAFLFSLTASAVFGQEIKYVDLAGKNAHTDHLKTV